MVTIDASLDELTGATIIITTATTDRLSPHLSGARGFSIWTHTHTHSKAVGHTRTDGFALRAADRASGANLTAVVLATRRFPPPWTIEELDETAVLTVALLLRFSGFERSGGHGDLRAVRIRRPGLH